MKIKIETHVYKNSEGVMGSIGRDQVGNQYHINDNKKPNR